MSFEPININISDPKLYADVAFAIDNILFIKEANKIRKRYKITAPFRNDNYQDWIVTHLGKDNIPKLFKDITDLRLFIGFDSNYQNVFEKAVLGCDIYDGDYEIVELINLSKQPSHITNTPSTLFAMTLTPQTRKKDIAKTFRHYKKITKQLQSEPDSYSQNDEPVDSRDNIKRDRNWYWKRVRDKTYRQIARESGINEVDFYTSYKYTIREAINAYKKKVENK